MKITHTISSIDNSTGGPARSVTHLLHHLAKTDSSLSLGLHTGHTSSPIIKAFDLEQIELNLNTYTLNGGFKSFTQTLKTEQADLLHGHALWQMPVHQMASYAQKNNVPYIITPRGMLEPWSLAQSRLKKQLALKLYQTKDLKEATCIHATAEMEAKNIRALGFTNPIAMIPNGVNITEYTLKSFSTQKKTKTLLFLSRIHYKKGIELLIEAWAAIAPKLKDNWQVIIVGNGEAEYLQKLNQMVADKGQNGTIQIKPPMYGAEKIKAYHNADVFVLPTYSENFGVVVAEALACGTPVITTKGTPWEELNTYDCGRWIDIGKEPLVMALRDMLSKTPQELEAMGNHGRDLIQKKYSMTAVAEQMLQLYKWILKKDKQPDFVYLD